MNLLGQFREGIARAVNLASDNHVFHEFPDCSILSTTNRVSIKLKDPHLYNALQVHWSPETTFDAITLLVRNEDNRKQTLMTAEIQAGNGITLKSGAGKPIMVVRTPNHDPLSLGKLMHPAPATLFKIMKQITPVGYNYLVLRSPSKEPVMKIEKVVASLYPIGKAMGLLKINCVYWFKRMDGTVLGYVRPKLVMNSNTLVVKFTSTNTDVQTRTAILGVSLLLAITEAYPQLRSMLDESMKIRRQLSIK
jgi:hypothetical protein